ncbi:MAG: (Fe-S)-binding protein [Candidatus Bathyarchaeota archaeon]|nr:(Fe-S)-binding protein [Candidatus Bathyarchaeota archaeon]
MIVEEFDEQKLSDLYVCAQCGYCVSVCPTYEKTPWESNSPRGKLYFLKALSKSHGVRNWIFGPRAKVSELFAKRVYDCTVCGHCMEVCPVKIDLPHLWKKLRESIVKVGLAPKAVEKTRQSLLQSRNIFDIENSMRRDWADYSGAEIKVKDRAETVYFVGCVTSYSGRVQGIADSTVAILNHMNEDWTVLKDEWCCGHPLAVSGATKGFREFAEHNVKAIESTGARRVVTACPGCALALREEYPEVAGIELRFEVLHLTQLLNEYVEQHKMEIPRLDAKITYHDPCELGRLGGVLEEPRKVLHHSATQLVQPRYQGLNGRCCGSGGLLKGVNLPVSEAIADDRLTALSETGAQICVSACPSCVQMLKDAAARREKAPQVMDISELVAYQLALI